MGGCNRKERRERKESMADNKEIRRMNLTQARSVRDRLAAAFPENQNLVEEICVQRPGWKLAFENLWLIHQMTEPWNMVGVYNLRAASARVAALEKRAVRGSK